MKIKQIVGEQAKITKSDVSGVEITAADGVKTILPPEKTAALTPDPANPNEYDLNPAATSPTGDTPAGPKVGANVEMKTAEAMSDSLFTMPTTEFVKDIFAAATENGFDAADVDAVKKQMVLAANGEVDILATMEKAAQALQSPEFKQMLVDLGELVSQGEAQQSTNPELARIQQLAGTPTTATNTTAPTEVKEGAMSEIAAELSQVADDEDYDTLYKLLSDDGVVGAYLQDKIQDITSETGLHPKDDFEKIEMMLMDIVQQEFGGQNDDEGGETDDNYAMASAGFGSDEDYEEGIPGNVPTEKIPGKEDLLKGRGRKYYESADDKLLKQMLSIAGLK
jgi:hypothetical protein